MVMVQTYSARISLGHVMVAVTGAALTAFNRRKDQSSFRDWAGEAFQASLRMSDLDRRDIDLLVVASESDFFTLQLNPASILATDLGLIGAAALRVEGGGASGQLAVQAGVAAILSGQANHVAVVGVDPSASALSGDDMRKLYGYSFDAWTDGMTGVTSTALYALSWQVFASERGLTDALLDQITIQNRKNALRNPRAHLGRHHDLDELRAAPLVASPYRRLHCSPLSDGAAAVILSASGKAPGRRRQAPRIAGTGMASDHAHLGARQNPGDFTAKALAARKAYAMADIAPSDIELIELYDAYAGAQVQALAALGVAEDVERDLISGRFAPGGRAPVNLSGGLMGQGAPVGATGVGQVATCALIMEGRSDLGLQPQTLPAYALADTHGGVCTTAAVTVLAQADAA